MTFNKLVHPLKLIQANLVDKKLQFEQKDPEKLSMICDKCKNSIECGMVGGVNDRWCLWWLRRAKKLGDGK